MRPFWDVPVGVSGLFNLLREWLVEAYIAGAAPCEMSCSWCRFVGRLPATSANIEWSCDAPSTWPVL